MKNFTLYVVLNLICWFALECLVPTSSGDLKVAYMAFGYVLSLGILVLTIRWAYRLIKGVSV